MISSKGASGVTGAGFVTLAATLTAVPSVPIEAVALLVGIDRFMSECRAITNLIGNAVATIVESRSEGDDPGGTARKHGHAGSGVCPRGGIGLRRLASGAGRYFWLQCPPSPPP